MDDVTDDLYDAFTDFQDNSQDYIQDELDIIADDIDEWNQNNGSAIDQDEERIIAIAGVVS